MQAAASKNGVRCSLRKAHLRRHFGKSAGLQQGWQDLPALLACVDFSNTKTGCVLVVMSHVQPSLQAQALPGLVGNLSPIA